jgi:hypothetical protein
MRPFHTAARFAPGTIAIRQMPALMLAVGLIAAVAVAPWPAASAERAPATAPARDAGLHYKVYIGGFHVVDLDIAMDLAPGDYKVEARLKTIGMIGSMFPWTMKAHSNGRFDADKVVPAAAGQRSTWNGKPRFIEMRFDKGLPVVEEIKPLPNSDDRDPVPESVRKGALDLTSAILSLLTRMENGKPCMGKIPVFDGRRRFDLVAVADGPDRLRANRYSPYDGPAETCIVSMDPIAGFKKSDHGGWNDGDRKAHVWTASPFAGMPPVPVRITVDTPLGALIAHLNHASYRSGAQQAVLSHSSNVRRAGMPGSP